MTQKEINFENKLIDDILNEFDFIICHKVMVHLNWSWFSINGIPTIEDLKIRAKYLLREVIKLTKMNKESNYQTISTGGLKAVGYRNKSYKITDLKLEFILTEWTSDGDED
jgi:hypothetical protein